MTAPIDLEEEVRRLKSRVADLERFQQAHLGPEQGTAGGDYPHPNIRVASTIYGGGKMRLDPAGIQIQGDDSNRTPAALFIVPEFFFGEDLAYDSGEPVPDRDFWSGITGNADNSDNYIRLISRNYTGNLKTWYAQVVAYADQSNAQVLLSAQKDAGTAISALLNAFATGLGIFSLSNTMLKLDSETADPTLNIAGNDGMLIYRSDTDRAKLLANGAWVDLIASDHASWVDLTDGGASTLHSHAGGLTLTATEQSGNHSASNNQVVIYTGTGGHTITLPDAAAGTASDLLIVIKNAGTGTLTVDGTSTQTIDGSLTITLAPYDSVILYSSTGDWHII